MTTFVLIHGAWHGAWCWNRVAPILESHGHKVVAPDLPGMGRDTTAIREVTLQSWARFVEKILLDEVEPVVLVGHSRAGVIISQAAEYAPDRIRRLVYLAAFLVPNGSSMREAMLRAPRDPSLPADVIPSADGVTVSLLPGAIERTFFNTTDAQWSARASQLTCPEPIASITTAVSLSPSRFGSIPRAYIECLRDNAVPIRLQRLMQADLPCDVVAAIDSDHSPFFSAPEELARVLMAM